MSDLVDLPKASEARERLLRTAAGIFYREGIHAVGVDRVVSEAGVTRATFYRHFPSKDDLVRAYIELEDQALRTLFASAMDPEDPEANLDAVIAGIAADVEHHHTRGCPFINAAAEFPDAAHPVRVAVSDHRRWFAATLRDVLEAAGHDDPVRLARTLVLLRDAALVGAYLDGPEITAPAFVSTAREVLTRG